MDNNRSSKSIRKTNKAACLAAFLLVSAVLYLLAGIFFGFYIPCPFRTVTGFRCPGCGMSHAATDIAMSVWALIGSDRTAAQSHIMDAFRANALFIPIFAYIIYSFIRYTFYKDTKQNAVTMTIDIVFLIVLIAWWILRNIIVI